jgi:hypothetical protein
MVTKAVTLLTNVCPARVDPAPRDDWGELLGSSRTTRRTSQGYLVDANVLFDQQGNDTISDRVLQSKAPTFYMESKKYKVGDSLRKKLFKQLAIHYNAAGGPLNGTTGLNDALTIDTVIGLNNVGKTSTTKFPATIYTWDQLPTVAATWDALAAQFPTWDALIASVFKPKRVKFLKRSQFLAFRLYQTDNSVTRVELGPFQLGFKLQRPGRI